MVRPPRRKVHWLASTAERETQEAPRRPYQAHRRKRDREGAETEAAAAPAAAEVRNLGSRRARPARRVMAYCPSRLDLGSQSQKRACSGFLRGLAVRARQPGINDRQEDEWCHLLPAGLLALNIAKVARHIEEHPPVPKRRTRYYVAQSIKQRFDRYIELAGNLIELPCQNAIEPVLIPMYLALYAIEDRRSMTLRCTIGGAKADCRLWNWCRVDALEWNLQLCQLFSKKSIVLKL
jgi:hypothetical protein